MVLMGKVESRAMALQYTSFFLTSKYLDALQLYFEKRELAQS